MIHTCGLLGHSMLIAAVGQGGVPFVVNWIFSFLISLILSYRVVNIFRYRHQPFTLVGGVCSRGWDNVSNSTKTSYAFPTLSA